MGMIDKDYLRRWKEEMVLHIHLAPPMVMDTIFQGEFLIFVVIIVFLMQRGKFWTM